MSEFKTSLGLLLAQNTYAPEMPMENLRQLIATAEFLNDNELVLLIEQLQDLRDARLCTCHQGVTQLVDSGGAAIVTSETVCGIHTPELLRRYTSQGYVVKK